MDWLYQLDYYHWLLFGLLLLVLEVFVGGAFLMWIGFSALLLGVLLLVLPYVGLYLGWEWQLVLFGAGAVLSVLAWRRYMRNPGVTDAPGLNQRGSSYVGRQVRLSKAIEDGEGEVILDDTHWTVVGPELPAGTKVTLRSLNDMTFQVEPVD